MRAYLAVGGLQTTLAAGVISLRTKARVAPCHLHHFNQLHPTSRV